MNDESVEKLEDPVEGWKAAIADENKGFLEWEVDYEILEKEA